MRYGQIIKANTPGTIQASAQPPQEMLTPAACAAKATHKELGATEVMNMEEVMQSAWKVDFIK